MDLETKPFVKALSVDLVNSWLNISLDEKLATKVRWFNGKSFSLPTKSAKSRACVLACLVCLRARVLDVLACSRAWRACMHVLCLRASYDACLACLPLTYSRFCLIIYFVCISQGFAIKRKLLIHVNLS